MPSPDPIELLEQKLEEHQVALQKSINLYNQGLLDAATHVEHKINLKSLIDRYTYAIYILKEKKR